MIVRVVRDAVLALGLALALASAPAGAGASAGGSMGSAGGAARPPVALTASPARVDLAGAGRATVRVTNRGLQRVVVDVVRAGFALDLRGRPKIVAASAARRSAARWLTLRPRSVVLRPGAAAPVTVAAKPPARAEPGDHDALVLLTTRSRVTGRVAVRMRMGVVVVVRVPGAITRRLALRGVRVRERGRLRTIELVIANRGNVTESFARRGSVLVLEQRGRRIARLTAQPRTLRPGTLGVLQFRYRGPLSGPALARVDVVSESGRAIRRTMRLRL